MPQMKKSDLVEELLGNEILPIEKSTREFVASLNISEDKHKLALAAVACRLARKLDRDAGMATAAIAKELRETLLTIQDTSNAEDDFWKHFSGNPDVPTTIRNT